MQTAFMEAYPALLDQASRLQQEITVIQEKVNHLVRNARGVILTLPELHHPATGRIDARKIADFMGIPLKRLAEALDLNYKGLHRNPSATGFQTRLQPVKRVLEVLHEFFPQPESIRIWLNTPHPALDGATALNTILAKNPQAVLIILENALACVPV